MARTDDDRKFDWDTGRELERKDAEIDRLRRLLHATMGAFAIHADRYQRDFGLNGLHPAHYDILKECGGRMDDFKRATNAKVHA